MIKATRVTIESPITDLTVASGISASVGGKSVSGTPTGGGSSTVATVSSAAELTTALANANITTIVLNSSFAASPTITRSLTINFGTYTITGDVTFSHAGTGTSILTGTAANSIIGDLTVNTANASLNNGVRVSGSVNVVNVEVGTWTESADGNSLTITVSDGASITVTGSPGSVTVTEDASGNLTVTVNPGATVTNITTNAPVNIVVSSGATVTSITAGTGSDNTTIINDGTTGTVAANAPINLVANVAPAATVIGASGNVTTSGTDAASVNIVMDVTAPTLSAPSVSAVGDVTASLEFTSNEAGRYYYLVYAAAAAAPDAATIKAQGAGVTKGVGTAVAAVNTVNVTRLSASTAYKAYVMVEDTAGNLSAVATINITTTGADSSIPVALNDIMVDADKIVIGLFQTVSGEDSGIADVSIDDFSLIKDYGLVGEEVISGIRLSIDPLGGTWEYNILPPTGQVFVPGTYRLTLSKAGYETAYVTVEIAEPYPAPVPGTVNGDMMHWKIETDGLEANTVFDIQLKDGSFISIATDVNGDIIFNEEHLQALIDNGPDTLQIRRSASDTHSASTWVDLLEVTSMGDAPTAIIRSAGADGLWNTGDEMIINTTATSYNHVEWKIGNGGWNGHISGTPAFLGGVGGPSNTEISNLTIPSATTSVKIRRQGMFNMLPSATYEVP